MDLHPHQRDALRRLGVAGRLRVAASLWMQAAALKRGTVRALHPDWDDERVDRSVREAMSRAGR